MQGLSINLSQQQRLSPQQIQLIKLLQIPTAELAARIEAELEENPALEEGISEERLEEMEDRETVDDLANDEMAIDDYLQDDYAGYKMAGDSYDPNEEMRERPMPTVPSAEEFLLMQIGFVITNERERIIAEQLIGSLEDDGYLRRNIESIVNDLAFTVGFETDYQEVERVLLQVQQLDPAGIGARDLQECLSIQLHRKHFADEHALQVSIRLIDQYFDEFSKKHYSQLQQKLGVDDALLKQAINIITHLNPKPGGSEAGEVAPFLQPDFIVSQSDGKLDIKLNGKNAPELRVSKSFQEMLQTYSKGDKQQKEVKEAVTFIKHKLDSASWFIQAIQQRQGTLLKTMESIVGQQYDFFLTGDESKLKPMRMKEIAEVIEMDISTVSRVVSAKSVQTDFGMYPLKYFFSEGITHESGEDFSTREVKNILRDLIAGESAGHAYSDEELEGLLAEKGFVVKRRTVAKYREQLGIPVARLRRKME
ncbi:RNA polymerase factor sigma-54 [Aquirufa sp. LEPPI-3A]|uniref:RNA polymerase factor sigma-54 n=1 Tax=Aquirufa regiilacus TaxID=3024868 RepID=UPI0028DE43F0|nr:RNA polymerase factor sigma-54 [Aquirufa sp. LEPPI-3A]MDT8886907.1 RNA polymerase factor sigma-54 [Aquirufa sp. LEPPI-3A]